MKIKNRQRKTKSHAIIYPSLHSFLILRHQIGRSWSLRKVMTICGNNGDAPKQTLIFSYGTLKRGFSNHKLMQDLISRNDALFLGNYVTDLHLPLVRGPHGVPFLLNLPGRARHRVRGELYSVSDSGLQRLDLLEGITLGHYERLPITVTPETCDAGAGGRRAVIEAEAYYAHRSFAEDMWRKSGQEGFESFNHEVAKGYVRRDLRPKDRSFREQITLFCSSN